MKAWSLLICLMLAGCAHRAGLEEKVHRMDAKTIEEVKTDAEKVLEAHPELASELKARLRTSLNEGLKRHKALKEKESRVLQLMLRQTIDGGTSLGPAELLKGVYAEKAANITALVREIQEHTRGIEGQAPLLMEMGQLIREIR